MAEDGGVVPPGAGDAASACGGKRSRGARAAAAAHATIDRRGKGISVGANAEGQPLGSSRPAERTGWSASLTTASIVRPPSSPLRPPPAKRRARAGGAGLERADPRARARQGDDRVACGAREAGCEERGGPGELLGASGWPGGAPSALEVITPSLRRQRSSVSTGYPGAAFRAMRRTRA